jgi:hypothetical protein
MLLGEFSILNPYRYRFVEQLYDDFIAHGITKVRDGYPITPKEEINFFVTSPVYWR